VPRCLGGGSPI